MMMVNRRAIKTRDGLAAIYEILGVEELWRTAWGEGNRLGHGPGSGGLLILAKKIAGETML